MNVRPPRPADDHFLQIQDEYLQEEVKEKGVTDSADLPLRGWIAVSYSGAAISPH